VVKNLKQHVIALTGTSEFIGNHALRAFIKDPEIRKIVIIDEVRPRIKNSKIIFAKHDLTLNDSIDDIARTLKKHRCHTLIHSGAPRNPSFRINRDHEQQVMGTMNILLSSELADIDKLVLISTTDVYGALPGNPTFLKEDHPCLGGKHSSFLKDKIDMEKQFLRFGKHHPKKIVSVLRPCTILGPHVHDFKSTYFSQSTVPTVLGFDPLMQFIHVHDVIRGLLAVVKKNHRGIFNLVGDDVLPFSRALRIAGKVNLPLPSWIIYPSAELLWYMDIGLAPASHVDFLK